MRKRSLFFIYLLLSSPLFIAAQVEFPEFGIYSADELQLKVCPFDKSADAIVLLDQGSSNYDDNYNLITVRRVRLKILHQRGLERGNISIKFYSKNKFESLRDIKGMTFNPDDASVTNITKKSIYTEKLNEYYSETKFAMPNLKVGSIIEYEYKSVMESYGGLQDWVFQSELPTMKSCYELQMLPNVDFSYVVSKSKYYPIRIVPYNSIGKIYYEMNDLPGLKYEPYMDSPRDYLQKVEFQFSGITETTSSNGFTSESRRKGFNETWKDIAKNLGTDKDYGGATKVNLPIPPELKIAVDAAASNRDKTRIIFNYTRDKFAWNGIDSKFTGESLKKVWDKKSGMSGEINLLLISLLQSFKIDAWPLMVAERDFGKIFPEYPLIDKFNKIVAYVNDNGNAIIMDATLKYCPFGLIPYPLLNTYGLILNNSTDKLLLIENKSGHFRNNVLLNLKIAPDGKATGTAAFTSDEYAKEFFISQIKDNEQEYIKDYITSPREGLIEESFSYEYPNTDTGSLTQLIKFTEQYDESGGFILFNYNLFTGLTKNPFVADIRFTNVNFGYPFDVTIKQVIEIPAGSKLEKLPENKSIESASKDIFVSRKMNASGNQLEIEIQFRQTITLVLNGNYDALKGFYKKIADFLNDPVVIKLGK